MESDVQVRIAFPTDESTGLEAQRCPHFGHAAYYTIVDLAAGEPTSVTTIPNRVHDTEGCTGPIRVLGEHGVEVLVVTGIGGRPYAACQQSGIEVLREETAVSVADAIAAWNQRAIAPFDPSSACSCSE